MDILLTAGAFALIFFAVTLIMRGLVAGHREKINREERLRQVRERALERQRSSERTSRFDSGFLVAGSVSAIVVTTEQLEVADTVLDGWDADIDQVH